MANTSGPPGMPPPMMGLTLAITSIALALGTFMQVLDGTIANVSIPTIAGNLGVSASQGTWVITSFAVANGVSVPLTGWLMGRYGVVRTFVGSVVLFTLASFLCGVSWDLTSLIVFRILQGGVSGPMIPGSQALLIMIFPPLAVATRGAAAPPTLGVSSAATSPATTAVTSTTPTPRFFLDFCMFPPQSVPPPRVRSRCPARSNRQESSTAFAAPASVQQSSHLGGHW